MTTELMLEVSLEIWGVIILIACIFVAIGQFHIFEDRNKYLIILLGLNAIMLAVDAFGRCYAVDVVGTLPSWVVRGLYFLVFELGYLLSLFFLFYIGTLIKERNKSYQAGYIYAEGFVVLSGTVLLIMTQFNNFYYYFDANMKYHRQKAFSISMLIGIIGIMLSAAMIFQYRKVFRKNDRIALFVYIILPVLALVVQIGYKGFSLLNIATTTSLLFIFIVHEVEITRMLQEKQELLHHKEQEESQRRYELLHSQIEPHFLYNTLSTISALCYMDGSMKAKNAIDKFATYFRENLDTMGKERTIVFEKELEHIKTYLWFEQLRFEDALNVEYDILVSDFSIPSLSIQPLVENAIKHGIRMKKGGGTVCIQTRELSEEYQIIVSDDGVGYEVGTIPEDGRSHTGIENIKARLHLICDGTCEIESKNGQGTTVTVHIPKERGEAE